MTTELPELILGSLMNLGFLIKFITFDIWHENNPISGSVHVRTPIFSQTQNSSIIIDRSDLNSGSPIKSVGFDSWHVHYLIGR